MSNPLSEQARPPEPSFTTDVNPEQHNGVNYEAF